VKKRLGTTLAILGILVGLAAPAPAADQPKPIALYTAWALNMLGGGGGTTVTIGIYAWSSDAERQGLTAILKAAGSEKMVAEMSMMPQVGYIYTQGTLAWALYYAHKETLPDGTIKIVCATNRPLSFGASISGGTKNNYDLGVLQMMIPPKGDGEGKVIGMGLAKIDPKTGKIEIENYGGQPTRLLQIKAEKP
jgi:hypothetical protein